MEELTNKELLIKIWRGLVLEYLALLEKGDLTAAQLQAVNSFLAKESITATSSVESTEFAIDSLKELIGTSHLNAQALSDRYKHN